MSLKASASAHGMVPAWTAKSDFCARPRPSRGTGINIADAALRPNELRRRFFLAARRFTLAASDGVNDSLGLLGEQIPFDVDALE